jgi:hypothetical protein
LILDLVGVRARGAARRGYGKVERGHRWGRRKLNGVTDGAPEKGRWGYTFSHTERAATAQTKISRAYATYTQIGTRIYTHTYTHIYTRIYMYLAILMISKNYTEANESIAGWLNGLPVSMHYLMLYIC